MEEGVALVQAGPDLLGAGVSAEHHVAGQAQVLDREPHAPQLGRIVWEAGSSPRMRKCTGTPRSSSVRTDTSAYS